MTTAIVCGGGGYRTVFIQGVLSALEDGHLRADAYAGTSASGIVAASAAIGESRTIGLDYWRASADLKARATNGMSEVMFAIIREWGPFIKERLFKPNTPRFFIPASAVITESARLLTQGSGARRLGRQLLLAAARADASWAKEHLQLHLYDTLGHTGYMLTPENFDEVFYASTRMMHAWDIPATISGHPYVDASYLCACPAVEVAQQGYDRVIAISADPGPLYRDIFRTCQVPEVAPFHIIRPSQDPSELGADFTDATYEGLEAVYAMGWSAGQAYLMREADQR